MGISRKWKSLLINVYISTNAKAARSSLKERASAYSALIRIKNALAGACNEERKLQIVQKSFVDGTMLCTFNTIFIAKHIFSTSRLPLSSGIPGLPFIHGNDDVLYE